MAAHDRPGSRNIGKVEVVPFLKRGRSDYVEIDLESFGIPEHLDGRNLRLTRHRPKMPPEEIPYQIDYPFGREVGYRVMTLFSVETPAGSADYEQVLCQIIHGEVRVLDEIVLRDASTYDVCLAHEGLGGFERLLSKLLSVPELLIRVLRAVR